MISAIIDIVQYNTI